MKKQKGITLIALIITIIVMLILVGVTVNVALNGGLFETAKKASKDTQKEMDKEELQAAVVAAFNAVEGIVDGEKLRTNLPGWTVQENGPFICTSSNGNTYTVNIDGTIIYGQQGGLDDERLNNEEIVIETKEELYALGRILLDGTIRRSIFSTYTTDGKYEEDLSLFNNIPSEYTEDAEKVEYLRTASYRLENDITIKFDRTADYDVFFMGIGSNTKKFSGFFNGNGKNIIIEGSDLKLNNNFNTLSLFGYTKDAVIANMNVNIIGDIKILFNAANTKIGIIAGYIEDTTIYNNNVTFNDGSIGVDYMENNQYYNNLTLSSVVGGAVNKNKIEKCTVNMNNGSEIYIKHNDDSKTNAYYCGIIVGSAQGTIENRIKIDNCNINMQNSKCYMVVPQQGCVGGIVGISAYTDISNSNVILNNSQIGIESIDDAGALNQYYSVCVGGIIGFSQSGSSNSDNVGEIGNAVNACSFKAENDTQKEVLYAKISKGGAPNTGGIIGITFNNAVVNNCNVDIKNAIMIAQRTEESTEEAAYGATIGGIVGRLEHTGQVKDCNVNSQNSKLIAKSTGKEIYCAGIVGIDMGPYHRNVISIENNKFTGNNTTLLEVDVISGEHVNSLISIGGISGFTRYIMKDCQISGTNIEFKGATNAMKSSNIGKIAGRIDFERTGFWIQGTYFEPNTERGILNCTSNNVNIAVEGEDITKINTGDVYGYNG